jgi:hypothetical protein
LKEYIYIKKNGKDTFNNEINLISYNEKDLVKTTWKKNNLSTKINKEIDNKQEMEELPNDYANLDEDSDTDIESDNDEDKSLSILRINRLAKNINNVLNTTKNL